MPCRCNSLWPIVALFCGTTLNANAAAWNEAVNGDFSNNGLAPTAVAFANGVNTVLGTTGNAGQGVDRDYFTFVVPTGTNLTALRLLNNTTVSGSSSFIGIQAGSQVTVSPSGAGAENLIALGHYSNDQIGTNILPSILLSPTGTLPSGTYSVWVQELGGLVDYGFDFVITPATASESSGDAPLPTWAYLVLALGLLTCNNKFRPLTLALPQAGEGTEAQRARETQLAK